uniref:Methenyltetrahydrofolate synthetase domain containing n=1 Tax=Gorilla gorilla gorilla TaxID=9595 RepID=A0A2I2Z8A8_GORGO
MEPRAVGVSKQDIREQIWGYMESQNLADFPRPVHHRIPNFKSKKTLLVPTPRLRTGLFNKITPPPGATKDILRKFFSYSRPVHQVPPERDRISKTCSIGNCLTSSK